MVPTTHHKLETLKQELQEKEKKEAKRKKKLPRTQEPRADRERDEFTPYQNELYKRVVFGLSLYPQSEINKMHWERRQKIKKNQKSAQRVINAFKQQVINLKANFIFEQFFPESEITEEITRIPFTETDPSLECNIEFKDLGVTKKDIADQLIRNNVLPKDFYKVRTDPSKAFKMPRLKAPKNESQKQAL